MISFICESVRRIAGARGALLVVRGFAGAGLLAALLLLGTVPAAAQTYSLQGLGVTGGGGGATAFNGTIGGLAGQSITVTFTNSSGAAIPGAPPVTVPVDGNGNFSVPIPVAAQGFKNKAVISYADPNNPGSTASFKPVIWYNSNWVWGTTAAIKIDPIGFPGGVATGGPALQSWFVQSATPLDELSGPVPGNHKIVASNFTVSYSFDAAKSNATYNAYDMTISGNNSYLEFSDDTELDLPNGTAAGTIDIPVGCTATSAETDTACDSGPIDYSLLGVSGTWDFEPSHDYSDLGGDDYTPFGIDDPAITQTPEPASLVLFGSGLLALAALRRRHLAR